MDSKINWDYEWSKHYEGQWNHLWDRFAFEEWQELQHKAVIEYYRYSLDEWQNDKLWEEGHFDHIGSEPILKVYNLPNNDDYYFSIHWFSEQNSQNIEIYDLRTGDIYVTDEAFVIVSDIDLMNLTQRDWDLIRLSIDPK